MAKRAVKADKWVSNLLKIDRLNGSMDIEVFVNGVHKSYFVWDKMYKSLDARLCDYIDGITGPCTVIVVDYYGRSDYTVL